MIYRLRKKFIKICTLSFLAVFVVLFSAMLFITNLQTTATLDTLADIIADGGGRFPDFDELYPEPLEPPDGITQESPFTTRYFVVHFDTDGTLNRIDTRAIASINNTDAAALAKNVLESGNTRGWAENYRYKVTQNNDGTSVIFVNSDGERSANRRFLFTALGVFTAGSLVVLLLVILFSKRAVRPVAESVDKQKTFITDSGHELKTPLTLIRTNLDILESDIGPNTWLDDIRTETDHMTDLVNRLVQLARMDENTSLETSAPFDFSALVTDLCETFTPVATQNGQSFSQNITPGIQLTADETAISQLLGILLDNACKYCDAAGHIHVSLTGGKHPILSVQNTYAAVQTLDLSRLFDRFYREDRARTTGSGFGLGLAIAKATCDKHHAQISAQATDATTICFRVRF